MQNSILGKYRHITFTFSFWFIVLGLGLQVFTYLITGESWLSLFSGCAGVLSVVLCSNKKLSSYLFGFLQLGSYTILAWNEFLYGEVMENIFYAVTMILGIVLWKKNYSESEVKTRKLSKLQWFLYTTACFLGVIWLARYLGTTNDKQPILDSITTIPAIFAQIFMILRYREQWIFWLIIDLATILLWYRSGNWCMVSQYVFWSINCIYGWILWSKEES